MMVGRGAEPYGLVYNEVSITEKCRVLMQPLAIMSHAITQAGY